MRIKAFIQQLLGDKDQGAFVLREAHESSKLN